MTAPAPRHGRFADAGRRGPVLPDLAAARLARGTLALHAVGRLAPRA